MFAGFVIVQLTIRSASYEAKIKQSSKTAFLVPFASAIVPASVSVLNAVQPPIMHIIAQFEKVTSLLVDFAPWALPELVPGTAQSSHMMVPWTVSLTPTPPPRTHASFAALGSGMMEVITPRAWCGVCS
jgi:hypothetical protein